MALCVVMESDASLDVELLVLRNLQIKATWATVFLACVACLEHTVTATRESTAMEVCQVDVRRQCGAAGVFLPIFLLLHGGAVGSPRSGLAEGCGGGRGRLTAA